MLSNFSPLVRYCAVPPSLGPLLNRDPPTWPKYDSFTWQDEDNRILESDPVSYQCKPKFRFTSDENKYETSLICNSDGTWNTTNIEPCVEGIHYSAGRWWHSQKLKFPNSRVSKTSGSNVFLYSKCYYRYVRAGTYALTSFFSFQTRNVSIHISSTICRQVWNLVQLIDLVNTILLLLLQLTLKK